MLSWPQWVNSAGTPARGGGTQFRQVPAGFNHCHRRDTDTVTVCIYRETVDFVHCIPHGVIGAAARRC